MERETREVSAGPEERVKSAELNQFSQIVQAASNLVPVTHGIKLAQDLLFRGTLEEPLALCRPGGGGCRRVHPVVAGPAAEAGYQPEMTARARGPR